MASKVSNGKSKTAQAPAPAPAAGSKNAPSDPSEKKAQALRATQANAKAAAAAPPKGNGASVSKKASPASAPVAGAGASNKEIVAAAPKIIVKPKVSFVSALSVEMKRKLRDEYAKTSRAVDTADSERKDKQKMGIQITLPIVFTRGSRDNSTMLGAVIADLATMASLVNGVELHQDEETGETYVEVTMDIRNAEQRKADEAAGLKLEDTVIHKVEHVQNTVDEFKEIRRVVVRYSSFSSLSLINKSNNKEVKEGTFAVVNIEPRVWRDDSGRIASIVNLMGVQTHQKIPVDKFVGWMRSNGIYTKHFETKIPAYRREKLAYIKEHGAEPDKKTEQGFNFRKDNEMTVLLGFNHGDYLDENLCVPAGCTFVDDSKRSEAAFKYFDKASNTNLARYQMSLLGEQWEQVEGEEPCYPYANKSRITRFQLNIYLWSDFTQRLDIYSVTAWKLLAPVNMPYLKAVAFMREKAADSMKNDLNSARIQELDKEDDINLPAPPSPLDINIDENDEEFGQQPNRLSFVLETSVDALLFDPAEFPRTVGLKVSGDAVKRYLFDGKSTPKALPDAKGAALEVTNPVICLSELKNDAKRVLDSDAFELRVITNLRGIDTDTEKWEQDMFGKLDGSEAELTLAYLASVVAKKQTIPLDAFLKTKRVTIGNDHILRRFKFMIDGAEPIFYVYAINLAMRKELEEDFLSFVTNLKDAEVSQFAPLLTGSASQPPLMLKAAGEEQGGAGPEIEEVKEPSDNADEGNGGEDQPMPDAPNEEEEGEEEEKPSASKSAPKAAANNKRKRDESSAESVADRASKKPRTKTPSLSDLNEQEEEEGDQEKEEVPSNDPMEGVDQAEEPARAEVEAEDE